MTSKTNKIKKYTIYLVPHGLKTGICLFIEPAILPLGHAPSRQNKMVDVKELCDDGYRLAIQAVDLDKIGSGDAAAFFYIEAAEALIKALSYDPTLDVKGKASQYIRRAEELRAQEQGSVFLKVLMEWLYLYHAVNCFM